MPLHGRYGFEADCLIKILRTGSRLNQYSSLPAKYDTFRNQPRYQHTSYALIILRSMPTLIERRGFQKTVHEKNVVRFDIS